MIIIASVIAILSLLLIASSKGMRNTFSFGILMIIDLLIFIGSVMVYRGDLLGTVPILVAGMFMLGFKVIQGANPRKVGIVTFFGSRTSQTAEGLTLLCNWPVDIVGISEYSTQLEDLDFPIENIRSSDGVRLGGIVSLGIVPDEKTMDKFDDAKGFVGIKKQLDEIILSWLQQLANDKDHNWKWFEANTIVIQKMLTDHLNGIGVTDDDSLVNAKELGFKIKKLSVKLKPLSSRVIEADEDVVVEQLERMAEIEDTKTVNEQAHIRFEMYEEWQKSHPGKIPTLAQCRDEILRERLVKKGKVEAIESGKGSKTFNVNPVGGGKKP